MKHGFDSRTDYFGRQVNPQIVQIWGFFVLGFPIFSPQLNFRYTILNEFIIIIMEQVNLNQVIGMIKSRYRYHYFNPKSPSGCYGVIFLLLFYLAYF